MLNKPFVDQIGLFDRFPGGRVEDFLLDARVHFEGETNLQSNSVLVGAFRLILLEISLHLAVVLFEQIQRRGAGSSASAGVGLVLKVVFPRSRHPPLPAEMMHLKPCASPPSSSATPKSGFATPPPSRDVSSPLSLTSVVAGHGRPLPGSVSWRSRMTRSTFLVVYHKGRY